VIDVPIRACRLVDDLPLEGTPIARVRSGVRNGDDLRLVLDLRAAVRPRSFALRASDRAADRLVIDLYDARPSAARRSKSAQPAATAATSSSPSMPATAVRTPGALGPGGCGKRWCSRSPGSCTSV
jgi:N-acetylmuramoyl-L-alanine amidase